MKLFYLLVLFVPLEMMGQGKISEPDNFSAIFAKEFIVPKNYYVDCTSQIALLRVHLDKNKSISFMEFSESSPESMKMELKRIETKLNLASLKKWISQNRFADIDIVYPVFIVNDGSECKQKTFNGINSGFSYFKSEIKKSIIREPIIVYFYNLNY